LAPLVLGARVTAVVSRRATLPYPSSSTSTSLRCRASASAADGYDPPPPLRDTHRFRVGVAMWLPRLPCSLALLQAAIRTGDSALRAHDAEAALTPPTASLHQCTTALGPQARAGMCKSAHRAPAAH
jgi:hypothetical protein